MNMIASSLIPTRPSKRLQSIDLLRGIAVLGILLMNIQIFAMIEAAYFNPTAFGDLSGVNYGTWIFTHVFADQKFMTIFSVLFGAGIVLMGERADAKGLSATWLHYKRMAWLLLLGGIHAYLMWYGDILVVYALSAMLVIWFRKRSARTQFVIGFLMLMIGSGNYFMAGLSLESWPPQAYQHEVLSWAPNAEMVADEIAIYQGSWASQLAHRVPHSLEFHTFIFLFWGLWRAGGLMLVGMACYRWGLFSAALESSWYRRLAIIGLGIGLPLVLFGVNQHESKNWDFDYSFFLYSQYNYWGSLFVSLGYVCLVMLLFQSGRMQSLIKRLAAVGRMAFSNYILQTVICTLVFYGHGLGWFGQTPRWQQLVVVLSVWLVIILLSSWWLARYRYGPLEWLWRSLTYLRVQPLRHSSVRGLGDRISDSDTQSN